MENENNTENNKIEENAAPAEAVVEAKAEEKPAVKTEKKKIKNVLEDIEQQLLTEQNNDAKFPVFNVGDTVRVYVKIIEGGKERVQPYEGVVISFKHGLNRKSFIVRRISFGVAIERVFPFHSPYLEKIEIKRRGRVRRAKLYYLRERFGKKAVIREKVNKKY